MLKPEEKIGGSEIRLLWHSKTYQHKHGKLTIARKMLPWPTEGSELSFEDEECVMVALQRNF